jgi:ribosomal protein S9
MDKIITSGKRKTSVARAVLTSGDGKITINKKNYQSFNLFDRLKIEEPLRIYDVVIGKKRNFNIMISVKGGGERSQIDAVRVALSRALVEVSKSEDLKKALISYDRSLLVADVRRKEAYKPGDSKARAKRQKSYR